ncbi:mediator of RNA polymerase II transcription subunit 15a [Rosa chinensis]|uniref:mediator of RNA polymerase II transcription subunit 15a n=1 Tax=Rosa chinensis TaxID=74649 RepID=UPI001AD8B070|nr:mediator of RNA polymerase II transcription subunit 15a [Rosa chinensis]
MGFMWNCRKESKGNQEVSKVHSKVLLHLSQSTSLSLSASLKILMDTNINSDQRPPQGGEAPDDTGNWRMYLMPDSRQRVVNKIFETLKMHLPFSGQEGLLELKRIALRFEEKVYAIASSQSDYLRKISLKMLTMEAAEVATSPPSNLKRHRVLAFETD